MSRIEYWPDHERPLTVKQLCVALRTADNTEQLQGKQRAKLPFHIFIASFEQSSTQFISLQLVPDHSLFVHASSHRTR